MNELIRVNNSEGRQTVNGRDLHHFLEVESNYTTWFKRMTEYGFTEGTDFITCLPNLESDIHGGQNKQDHQLTIEMAKELCMIQRTEKGKQARQYFVALERAWNSPEQVMARALQYANRQIEHYMDKLLIAEQHIEEQKPKVLFADAVEASHTSILVGDLAKLIKQNGYDIGGTRLFEWLRENGYLIKRKGTDWNMPTQISMDMKLFEVKESTQVNPDGSIRISKTPKVTGKGQLYFVNKFIAKEE